MSVFAFEEAFSPLSVESEGQVHLTIISMLKMRLFAMTFDVYIHSQH